MILKYEVNIFVKTSVFELTFHFSMLFYPEVYQIKGSVYKMKYYPFNSFSKDQPSF